MARKTNRKSTDAKPGIWGPMLGALVGAAIVAGIFVLTDRGSEPLSTEQNPVAGTPQQAQPATPQMPPVSEIDIAQVRRIDAQETKRLLDAGEAITIDVRDVQSYVAGHVPGALQIPLQYVPGEIPWFPRDKTIITYCT